ncbi:hypothetical protein [Haloferula rosea]|uniref:Uncharacterized protein n=1 Tax=Haloferula rosea TaxID=490093 RepID=A0A934VGB4_9BACT|nr:hypothetical protein [Haloferula rosea]MBK1827896.1 hypothetical protein [Haloferula rosea]
MKPRSTRPTGPARHEGGFALIITISLMVLLSLLAVGLLSLSTVSLRSSTQGEAAMEARQNARLAMNLAIGQLQSLAGQDTRVTANASLLDDSNAKLTGVWRSWEGTDRDASGRPVAPDYSTKLTSGNPGDEPGASTNGRFLGYLASPYVGEDPDAGSFSSVTTGGTASADFTTLLGEGSVIENDDQIRVKPTLLDESEGAIAWFTSGDNSKSMINVDRDDEPGGAVAWQERVRSNGRPDASVFALGDVDELYGKSTIPSVSTLERVNSSAELRRFHDLTSFSRGLLTNTANAGWRRDMSLFAHSYSRLSSRGLPLLTLRPGEEQTFSKAQSSSHPSNPLIYPWATYRSSPGQPGWKQVPPICSWTALADYLTQYTRLTTTSASRTAMRSNYAGLKSGERFNFQDQVRRVPQIARIHWIYSLSSAQSNSANNPNHTAALEGRYMAALMITPVVTLWNPYNVELTISNFGIDIQETAPLAFRFRMGRRLYSETSLSEITNAGDGYTRFKLNINSGITLAPGATQIFGLSDNEPKENSKASNVVLTPGYKPGGGFLFYGLNKGNRIYAGSDATISVDSITYNGKTKEGGKEGIGIVYNIRIGDASTAHRMAYTSAELGGDTVVDTLYPPLTTRISATLGEVEGLRSRAFASAVFGYRLATPLSRAPQHRHLYSKGMLQTNPLCYYTEVGYADNNEAANSMAGSGVYHPINAPYDFVFQEVQGWNDTESIPQFEPSSNSGYIVSGVKAGNGLTRCVMAELPTRPLQSLAQLQHFDARNNNPIPPFQFNLIGNSSAHPLFAPDSLFVQTDYNNGMCNDDAYFLNNMLFDDWFFSSVANDYRDFSNRTDRSISNVYQEHLEGTQPLPNRFYIPAPGADLPTVTEAVQKATSTSKDRDTNKYSFQTIASKFEVEGMFNINSVSLDAWRALLRQAKDLEVPYLDSKGNTNEGAPSSFSYPRTSIAGDRSTDSNSSESNPLYSAAAEFAGHRTLTEEQIDALAEEIVEQIRQRGPFLSLSEFVNRQVSSDKDLAIAGTIQKALDNLSQRSSGENPYRVLQEESVEITSAPPGNADYKFPEAALGSSAFGVPGWIRQADILTPIAPIISARDDTFTIRAYGDARDPNDANKILAKAWCEVVVKREASFVDSADDATVLPHSTEMTSDVNKRFGRRFQVVSFRWLKQEEV